MQVFVCCAPSDLYDFCVVGVPCVSSCLCVACACKCAVCGDVVCGMCVCMRLACSVVY